MTRRVVVTGLGMVSPLGNDLETSWQAALRGESGVELVTSFDASILGSQIAGTVKNFDATKYLGVKEVRRFDRFVHFGVAAGIMALEDSKLEITDELSPEIGVAIGAGIGGIPVICANYDALRERGPRRISPFMIPGCIINMVSGQLAIMKNLKGPNIAHVTACSTGLHAIGEAMHIIRRGDATVMIAGGAESTIHPLAMGAFDAMHALSRRNDDPKTASRPFDTDRDGFVMGEGAGVLVLEELEHAKARGAKIYAEIAGYGLSGDASLLIAKAIIDGIAAVVFAASLGKGVFLSILPLGVYQGGLTLLARFIRPWMTDELIAQMSCVGSVLIFAVSLNMIRKDKIKVGNLLPAVFLPVVFYLLSRFFPVFATL